MEDGEGATSSLLVLQWDVLGKNTGDVILISCVGESAGKTNGTGAWVSAAEMMETITVPGDATSFESSGEIEDEAEDDNDTSDEEDDDSSEEDDEEGQP